MIAGSAPAERLAGGKSHGGTVPAWDWPTRLFKWSLVGLVAFSYATYRGGEPWIGWHIRSGYAILVLLVFRVLWGLVGSSTARFRAWVTWPWTAVRYGLGLLRGRHLPYLGHNPLGGWMILALLGLALAQGVTGLFTVDNAGQDGGPFANLDFGDPTPLQDRMSRWHHLGFYVLIALAAVHIGANVWYQFGKGDPLITGMVTGRKPAEPYLDAPAMVPARPVWLRAIACLAAALAIVLGGVKLSGGALPG